ncbi:MAG: phytoene desaturase [Proteobacteria bacterium]|nr:phytoene desaturase [Pseudomonadota bacterium]
MATDEVIVVGAGIAGLAAAIELAARGRPVLVLERAAGPGGKARTLDVGGACIDAGPTVLTLPAVFESLLAMAGSSLAADLRLTRADVLARHAWDESAWLDLYADPDRSAAAIARFAGTAEARRYLDFVAHARRVYATLAARFLDARDPSLTALVRGAGLAGLSDLFALAPWRSLWGALGRHFRDPRLRQLYARYATYCGSSPFAAPATLALIAGVEQDGVWLVDGGIGRLVAALERAARRLGVRFRYGVEVDAIGLRGGRAHGVRLAGGETLPARAIVIASDVLGVAAGALGTAVAPVVRRVPRAARSLSALTLAIRGRSHGKGLAHHTVYFSPDYRAEFADLLRHRRLPAAPTVYVCAQDRSSDGECRQEFERFLLIINAPADGDARAFGTAEVQDCVAAAFARLARCGTTLEVSQCVTTTPADFHALFPGTGGALYGPAIHGWRAAFRRQGANSPVEGLYFAGGSTHPGPGMPMAAMSGRHAAAALLSGSTGRWRRRATRGGTSTDSATTATTRSR